MTTPLACVLISSNIGSVCEDPDSFLVPWITEIKALIEREKADFFTIGFQEVGGQKKVIKNVDHLCERFFKEVVNEEDWWSYGLVYETDVKSKQFTALGCIYCVRKSFLPLMKLWNFKTSSWESLTSVTPRTSSVGCSECPYSHHKRFENTDSRKGFLHSRWSWGASEVDLINVHLYHDESNVIASQEVPSVYAEKRVGALKEALDKCHVEDSKSTFIIGDLNFRLDLAKLAPWVKNRLSPIPTNDSSDSPLQSNFSSEDLLPPSISVPDLPQVLQIENATQSEVPASSSLLLEDKKFHIENSNEFYSEVFSDSTHYEEWRKMDCELGRFNARQTSAYLDELPIHFIPTYPIRVKAYDKATMSLFSSVRAPAWTDRVLFTRPCRHFFENNDTPKYNTHFGEKSVGDHLPVFLTFSTSISAATVAAPSSETTASTTSSSHIVSSDPPLATLTNKSSSSHTPSFTGAETSTVSSPGHPLKLHNEWLLVVFSDQFMASVVIVVLLSICLHLFLYYT